MRIHFSSLNRSGLVVVMPLLVSLVGCVRATPASRDRTGHSSGRGDGGISPELRALIEARIAGVRATEKGISSMGAVVVGVLRHGEGSFIAAGTRRPGGLLVDSDTLFKTCSLTKVLTGVLLADAVVRGQVQLSDEAQAHLPGVKLPRHKDGTIRVEHLATYSAGFPWQPTNFVGKAAGGYSLEAWRSFLETFVLPYPPGQGFQYGNVGFALLGDLLAENAAMPLNDLFRKRLFEPLQMRRSGFMGEKPDDENRAQGVDAQGKLVALDRDEPSQPAACALESTARDLMAFLRAHFDKGGPLYSAMKLALEARRPGTGSHAGVEMGLGWMLDKNAHIALKTGAIEGYRSVMALDLVRENAAVVLAADERVDQSLLLEDVLLELARADEKRTQTTLTAVPQSAVPFDVKFEDGLRLVGIEAPAEVTLGQDALVRYFYRVEQTPRYEWRAFVHADAKGERVKSDHALSRPMSLLLPGALMEDRVKLHFRPGLTNTSFTLFSGFFRRDKRMTFEPVTEDQRVRGPTIRVVAPASPTAH
ncbi:MAG: beta-lactamase family protein [Polyangiaceae bacterium]|nr:beta-lactamase family protein [Polyangiaceae bacterium]